MSPDKGGIRWRSGAASVRGPSGVQPGRWSCFGWRWQCDSGDGPSGIRISLDFSSSRTGGCVKRHAELNR